MRGYFERSCRSFFVPGTPAPGGSKKAFVPRRKDGSFVYRAGGNSPVVNITDAGGKGNKEWRKVVALTARQKWTYPPIAGPCIVEMQFFIRRPMCHYRTGKFAALLKDDAPKFHTIKPDVLKLARSTEDALTGICYVDDCQSIRIVPEKKWCDLGEAPGCVITIREL